MVASSLSSLYILFMGDEGSSLCHEILEAFFSICELIRNLRIECCDFGDDPDSMSRIIKDGFNRLNQFDMIDCQGNSRMFIETTPIPNLKYFRILSDKDRDEDFDIVNAIVMKYGRVLVNLNLEFIEVSSANLIKIAECCPRLERLALSFVYESEFLFLSDMKVIASLPCLRSLRIGSCCVIEDGAIYALARCSGLRYLEIAFCGDGLTDVLRVMGGNLISLKFLDVGVDAIASVVENCPDLQYLDVGVKEGEEDKWTVELFRDLRIGLNKLAKLKVNGWEGEELFLTQIKEITSIKYIVK
jgi:hypothetical protein